MAKTVTIDFRGLKGFDREIKRGLAGPASGNPIRDTLTQWGVRYLAFVKRRYVRASRGSGDWKPLAESTVKRRRRPKGRTARSRVRQRRTGGRVAILRDTSTLINALDVGNPGNLFKHVNRGVQVGFSGRKRHPGGKATVADIAAFHNLGEGDLPQRAILVPPDAGTVRGMISDIKRGVSKLLRKHDMRGKR